MQMKNRSETPEGQLLKMLIEIWTIQKSQYLSEIELPVIIQVKEIVVIAR